MQTRCHARRGVSNVRCPTKHLDIVDLVLFFCDSTVRLDRFVPIYSVSAVLVFVESECKNKLRCFDFRLRLVNV